MGFNSIFNRCFGGFFVSVFFGGGVCVLNLEKGFAIGLYILLPSEISPSGYYTPKSSYTTIKYTLNCHLGASSAVVAFC